MADYPLHELGGRTPVEAARTPAMDRIADLGICGLFHPIPNGFPAGSDIGNLSLFGYDPRHTFSGRAPLEAARRGIRLKSNEIAFRCNLVTLADGNMKSFTSDHIPTEEADGLIKSLNEALGGRDTKFYTGVSYRHLCVMSAQGAALENLEHAVCTPPHDISDQQYQPHLPQGDGVARLIEMMDASRGILAKHPINKKRKRNGKLPATSIWLWGQGKAPEMDTYQNRFHIDGAVVSAVDLVNGIGICAGLKVLEVPGATGYLDTDYEGKVAAALNALKEKDFVYLHVEAPDETSHEGRTDLKIRAIEDFDARVVAPCLAWAERSKECRILVAPDHITAIHTRTHAAGPVPFALWGPGIMPNKARRYGETEAQSVGLVVPHGHTLVPHMLRAAHITADSLASLG